MKKRAKTIKSNLSCQIPEKSMKNLKKNNLIAIQIDKKDFLLINKKILLKDVNICCHQSQKEHLSPLNLIIE